VRTTDLPQVNDNLYQMRLYFEHLTNYYMIIARQAFKPCTENLLFSREWLLFITERAIFQLVVYHDKNKIHFNEMMMMSALYWSNTPSWISIVLVHWDNSLWVYKLLHSDKLSRFLANQSLLLPGILCALRWSSTCQFYCQKFYWRRKPKECYVYKEFTYG
jgi:hypothetical protein